MQKTGSCLCGAVKYTVKSMPGETGACHCSMCRKWSGGIFVAFQAESADVSVEGLENIAHFKSSDWAERGFCKTCGSSLYYRVTAEGPHHGAYHIGMGTLDDPGGVTMASEIFIDEKPAAYSFSGDLTRMTSAEVFAMFSQEG